MKNTVLDFFGFSQIPFSKTLSPKQLFHSHDYQEAFAQLEYGIPVEDIAELSCRAAVVRPFSVALGSLPIQFEARGQLKRDVLRAYYYRFYCTAIEMPFCIPARIRLDWLILERIVFYGFASRDRI